MDEIRLEKNRLYWIELDEIRLEYLPVDGDSEVVLLEYNNSPVLSSIEYEDARGLVDRQFLFLLFHCRWTRHLPSSLCDVFVSQLFMHRGWTEVYAKTHVSIYS